MEVQVDESSLQYDIELLRTSYNRHVQARPREPKHPVGVDAYSSEGGLPPAEVSPRERGQT